MDRERAFHLLVELYRDEPDHLYRQFQAARHMVDVEHSEYSEFERRRALPRKSEAWDQDPRYEHALKALKDLGLELGPTVKCPQFAHFLMDLQPVRAEKMASFKRLVTEIAALVQSRFWQSEAFRLFITKDWHPVEFLIQSNGNTPFVTGLRRILSSQLTKFQANLIYYIKEQWPHRRHDERLIKGKLKTLLTGNSIRSLSSLHSHLLALARRMPSLGSSLSTMDTIWSPPRSRDLGATVARLQRRDIQKPHRLQRTIRMSSTRRC